MKIKKIYIDMDGVLSDFDKKKDELIKIHPDMLNGPADFWKHAGKVENLFWDLDPMPGAFDLMDYLETLDIPLAILTALPWKRSMPDAKDQKERWIRHHFGDIEFNVGPYAKQKKNFSGPGLMLIDDKEENIDQWKEAGGIGILYKNLDQALEEIKSYL